jgi:hypothetical protein
MSSVIISGDTSGAITLAAPAVSGTNTLTLPATTGSVIGSNSSGDIQFNSGYGSITTAYGCRAWVNFNGSGTVAIRASGNVTSITDSGVGDYTANFTTAMPDISYSAQVCAGNNGTGRTSTSVGSSMTAGSVQIDITSGGVGVDRTYVGIAIFR